MKRGRKYKEEVLIKKSPTLSPGWGDKYLDPYRSNHLEKVRRIISQREIFHHWEYEPTEQPPVICSKFGCAKELSMREQLFGSRCLSHQDPEEKIISVINKNKINYGNT